MEGYNYTTACVSEDGAKTGRPYARHDARRSQTVEGLSITGAVARVRDATDRFSSSLHGTASLLEDHADRLHGPAPKEVGSTDEACGPNYGDGQMGELFRALDALDSALALAVERVGYQAGRNSTIA